MLKSPALITSRDPRGRHTVTLFETAYNKSQLDGDRAQKLNERGGEFQDGVINLIKELTQSDRFANEEVRSNYNSKKYKGPKPICEQIEILLKLFPGLDPEATFRYMHDVYPKLNLPEWVEGPFAVPNEYVLAEKFYPEIKGRSARYCAGVKLILQKIGESIPFYNHRENQITPDHLRRILQTAEMIDRLIDTQKSADIIIHSMQLGMRYVERSVREIRETYANKEFGEGSLEVGSIILTHHPKGLVHWKKLYMDCAGDEYFPGDNGNRYGAPCFEFVNGVSFNTFGLDCSSECYGSVSGFLPQH